MRTDVARDLSASSLDFMRVVVPAISKCIGGGAVEPVESSTATGMSQSLDVLAGIDAWQVVTNEGVRGLSSRIQWGDKCWETFTVREHRPSGAATELEKRRKGAASRGYIYPHLTVQAYISEPRGSGRLLGAAVALTDDVMAYVSAHECLLPPWPGANPANAWLWRRANGTDGVTFICVPWRYMALDGHRVEVIAPAQRTIAERIAAAKRALAGVAS